MQFLRTLLIHCLAASVPAFAWKCPSGSSEPCVNVRSADAVFAGVVTSVDPDLRAWSLALTKHLGVDDPFSAGLKFDLLQRALVVSTPEPYRSRIASLKTPEALDAYLEEVSGSVKVRLTGR